MTKLPYFYLLLLLLILTVQCDHQYKNPFDTSTPIGWTEDLSAVQEGKYIRLTWRANSKALSGYQITRDFDILAQNILDTTYLDTTVHFEEEYVYYVQGFADRNFTGSPKVSCQVLFSAPTNLRVIIANDSTVTLEWTDNTVMEDGYEIHLINETQAAARIIQIDENQTQYVYCGLNSAYAYQFKVAAYVDNYYTEFITKRIKNTFQLRLLRSLRPSNRSISALAFSPDDRYLAYGTIDKRMGIIAMQNGNPVNQKELESAVTDLTFTDSAGELAIGLDYGETIIWNAYSWEQTHSLHLNSYALHDLCYNASADVLTVAQYKYLYNWSASDWEYQTTLTEHEENVNALAISPDNTILASGGSEEIKIWNTSDWSVTTTLQDELDEINTLVFSKSNDWLVAGGSNGNAHIWPVGDWSNPNQLGSDSQNCIKAAFMENDQYLVTIQQSSNRIIVWSVDSQLVIYSNTPGISGSPTELKSSTDGKWIAIGTENGDIVLYNAASKWETL